MDKRQIIDGICLLVGMSPFVGIFIAMAWGL
jgi:hypothetical protein